MFSSQFFRRQRARVFALILLFVFACFFSAIPALAQNQPQAADQFGLQPIEESTILGGEDIRLIIARIIRAVLGLLGIIALVLILYAGYTIMTSQGNEEKITTGKRTLTNAVIGLAIILSAFAITQFIINQLAGATGFLGGDGGAGAPAWQTFSGSGALGRVVRDHYPLRDQTDVARNTKITVTFNEPINPASVIRSGWTRASGDIAPLGSCKIMLANRRLDWATDCDTINTNAIKISAEGVGSPPASIPVARVAAMALYEGADNNVFTLVFRPIDLLGDNLQPVKYKVELTDAIMRKPVNNQRASSIFDRTPGNNYIWQFSTATVLDDKPPTVVVDQLYPKQGGTVPRNSIVQVTFSEPMDPTSVQGQLRDGGIFTNMVFSRVADTPPSLVTGAWKVANGYKTAEFVSSLACGQNSCGETMYCLPVPASFLPNDGQIQQYHALIRTGDLNGGLPFEAVPFSGVMDMAGNALDGDGNSRPASPSFHPPRPSDPVNRFFVESGPEYTQTPTPGAFPPDNFGWSFIVKNEIDMKPPYIEKVIPGIDTEEVAEQEEVKVNFSREMWYSTLGGLDGVTLDEYGVPVDHPMNNIWFWVSSANVNNKTIVKVNHRIFGPDNLDLYYFIKTNSKVKSLNQQCLYPGRGPAPTGGARGQSPTCVVTFNNSGQVTNQSNCVQVNYTANEDTGCVQTSNSSHLLKQDISACVDAMKLSDVSPLSL